MFVSHRADPEATVLDGLIDSVLADPMYSAEPLDDPIRDYSDKVAAAIEGGRELRLVRAIVGRV